MEYILKLFSAKTPFRLFQSRVGVESYGRSHQSDDFTWNRRGLGNGEREVGEEGNLRKAPGGSPVEAHGRGARDSG